MNPQVLFYIVSLITASLILILGIIILAGYLLPAYVQANYRIIMSTVMILYGTYRTFIAVMKIRNIRQTRRLDEKL
ncbi:MAG: hypothetical protein HY033_13340 [Ignavibacteriae bacterium]|nr:hypothetical protein [Ignavibacteria bacterium]MBI3365877.1 hypothetical protein [Ignavibacteriota bacterium]